MNICLFGAQGTGKTTLLKAAQKHLEGLNGIKFYRSRIRDFIKNEKLNNRAALINEERDIATQLKIMNFLSEPVFEASNDSTHIFDRTGLDAYVYSIGLPNQNRFEKAFHKIMYQYFLMNIQKIDQIFFLRPHGFNINDGERSASLEFQQRIDNLAEITLKINKLKYTELPNDFDKRVEILVNFIIDNYIRF